ncbi:MAG: RtcB family protein [Thermoplasmatota archaeon]
MNVPGRIVASPELLRHIRDDLAPEQVANVASLPGIVGHSLAMPDIHWGYGFPIGGVAAFDPEAGGVVSPGGVGFDINCGVRLLATPYHVDEVRPRLAELADTLFAQVPCGMGKRGGIAPSEEQLDTIMATGAGWAVQEGYATNTDREAMEESGVIEGARPELVGERARLRGKRTLGSLGSGNHFLEVQVVDRTWDDAACAAYGVKEGQVVVMIHTGSRGLGHQVCQDTVQDFQVAGAKYGIDLIDRQLACAPLDSPEAEGYLGAMAAAANFAFVNRSILTHHTRRVFAQLFAGSSDPADADTHVVYDVCHNIAKWEEHRIPGDGPYGGERRRVCVHRKGATRAYGPGHEALAPRFQQAGQPVIVPGDMGRQSFLLAADQGALDQTFGSSCHGAGRRLSRTAAKKQYDGQDLIDLLATRGILVRAASANVAAEEAPEAYKDVSQVVDSVEAAGLAHKAARLRPLCVVKG